ncbi:hypothetical protein [Leptospira santarosai]|uniref:hypothetical protein n=1 Tax=Leptospira santarosai TaxID=28183 RepID=UPI0024AF4393|nr:hypothetical protein [Leptospira santarosai]MDI7181696.1 hypothetical protein [Leptospira santarosai]
MTFRYTLEGDQRTELPEDAVLLRVKGKYIPTDDLGNGILNGDFYVEELDYHSPSRAQLSGEENSVVPVRLGTLYHDDAMPIALSGDELGMFGLAKLFGRGFKLPSFGRLPSFRGMKINTSGLSKGFRSATRSIQKAGKDVLKTGQKAFKDYGKTLQKGFKDAGKFAGKALEAVPDILQAVGQGQGSPEEGGEEQPEENPEMESEQVSEESFSEENPGPAYDESGFGDSLNGELGFFQAAMAAAPMITNTLSQFSNIQNKKTQAKSQARSNSISSLAQLLQSANRAPAKKTVPAQNKNFSNPALSKTSEGKFALTYSSNRGGSGEEPPAPNSNTDKKDDKMMLYAGGGLVAIIALVVVMNNMKGKK